MFEIMSDRHQYVYQWLLELGGDSRAVEFRPHEFIRKSKFLVSQKAVDRVEADLAEMEEDGLILIGPKTDAGRMVMATGKVKEVLLLTFERMVAMHALMSDHERNMLSEWEKLYLCDKDQLTTSDWPGWRIVFKRLAH